MTAGGLALLSLTLAYAVFQRGGVWTGDWSLCLLVIGLAAPLYFFRTRRDTAPPPDRLSQWLLLAFALLAILQLLPLPLPALRLLSPSRAELLDAAAPVLGAVRAAPLSALPAATVEHLMRLAGYLLVFLLVRDLAWQYDATPWLLAVPLLVIAVAEAVLGLFQPFARGTYVNRNHFAGLLEMCLPFAVCYAIAILRRTRSRSGFVTPAVPALKACGLLLLAAVILMAVLQSLSRMGFMVSLAALFAAGALSLRRRWIPVALLAVLLLAAFILLPGDTLIQRFAQLASTDALSTDMRVGMWRDTVNLIRAYPLFGCGLGSYESCFPKYQTVALMNTIDYAHNDYLQYAAELGILAVAIGLAFVLRLFRATIRTAIGDPSTDTRYIAAACAGSLTAIALHSLVDFNLYIPANATLLAWICGIAATWLRPSKAKPSLYLRPLGGVVLAGAALLALLSPAPAKSPAQNLRDDAASPYRWCDMGDELLSSGRPDQARLCFRQAVQQAPAIPPIWMRAVNFNVQVDDKPAAMAAAAELLKLVGDYDAVVYGLLDRLEVDPQEFLKRIADNRRAVSSYFRHLLTAADAATAEAAWKEAKSDELTPEYIDYLLAQRRFQQAKALWANNFPTHGHPGSKLDWKVTPVQGIEVLSDERSLRLRFQDAGNVNYHHTEQAAVVKPGTYEFQARVRTENLTTDQGLSFHIFDAESSKRLDVTTVQITGTQDWMKVTKPIKVPEGTNLLKIQLQRQESQKLDNRLTGQAWIDNVKLVPAKP